MVGALRVEAVTKARAGYDQLILAAGPWGAVPTPTSHDPDRRDQEQRTQSHAAAHQDSGAFSEDPVDVYKALLSEGADIGLATVYRVLTQFEQAGLLTRNHFESGKSVFELNEGHHHDHLVCLTCGRVEEFFDAEIEARQHAIAKERGFELQEHALSLYAACIKLDCPRKP